ncbi:Bro-N domain-containing protein [Aeromonas enteropelogenes]|uniref:BRO-N domain-containing protein n=1 Tax=Aeromonas enteropelogenes TaxID=29489 RepID=UPI003BA3B9DC
MFEIISYPSSSGNLEIRTIQKDGITLFSLADIVQAITKESQILEGSIVTNQISLLRESISALDDDERHTEVIGNERGQDSKYEHFITEPGIYRVVSRAKSSGAKKFQRWVYHDVMPALRKYGVYPAPQESDDSFILQLADQQAKQSQLLSQYIRQAESRFNEIESKFAENEKQLGDFNKRLINIENSNIPSVKFYSVEDLFDRLSIDSNNLIYVIALCEKICAEKNISYLPSVNKIRTEQKFTHDVIELALSYARLI